MLRHSPLSLALAAVVWLAAAGSAFAFVTKPYDAASFKAAQSAGQPVLVHVYAPWCSVCKAQEHVLGSLKDKPDYDKITIFTVDYDNQPDVVQGFGARSQSTMIAFKGAQEVGRSIGETGQASIEKMLATLK
jgi:thioredoxin-like negative regulator of GroEL